MAPKKKVTKPKAMIMAKHAAEQQQLAQSKPTEGKTWEYVCDCNEDECDACAPRKRIESGAPAHAARRSIVPNRFKDESSALKAPVPKAAAKKETKPPKPPVTAVSPAPQPAVLGERKRVRGH